LIRNIAKTPLRWGFAFFTPIDYIADSMAQHHLTKIQMEALERRARERVAWGAYAAYVRQTNFNERLTRCESREERRRLIEEGRRENQRGFWVG
jgi:hypothetical protein